jgi:hypothetical protein
LPIFLPASVSPLGSGETAGRDSERGYRGDSGEEKLKAVRAGRSLFDFMNDMLAGGGNFREQRKKIFKEYFGGADEIKKLTEEEIEKNSVVDTKEEDKGKAGEVAFYPYGTSNFKRPNNINLFNFGQDSNNEFMKIKYKSESGEEKNLIAYVMGDFKGNDKALVIKFHFSGSKNSIVHQYLRDQIDTKKITLDTKLSKSPERLYVGVININKTKNISRGKDIEFKYSEITGRNTIGEIKTLKIKILEVYGLGKIGDDGKTAEAIAEKPSYFLSNDITDINIIKNKAKDFDV